MKEKYFRGIEIKKVNSVSFGVGVVSTAVFFDLEEKYNYPPIPDDIKKMETGDYIIEGVPCRIENTYNYSGLKFSFPMTNRVNVLQEALREYNEAIPVDDDEENEVHCISCGDGGCIHCEQASFL